MYPIYRPAVAWSSFFIRSMVWSLLYSMTRFSLKYLTCRHNQLALSTIKKRDQQTQALAHAPSNSAISFPHFLRASPSFLMASTMSLRSRHSKNESRPFQHCWREVRSGAMRPPSEALGVLGSLDENQPMVWNLGKVMSTRYCFFRECLRREPGGWEEWGGRFWDGNKLAQA